ncbi:MAG: hypothetical protein K0B85_05750 [Coriobacteriia bacterium]|nr:hypothetical protein [Coriobacteriia bacterium]
MEDKILPLTGEESPVAVDAGLLTFVPVTPTSAAVRACLVPYDFALSTRNGVSTGRAGDFLVRVADGPFYVCPRDAFLAHYAVGVSDPPPIVAASVAPTRASGTVGTLHD